MYTLLQYAAGDGASSTDTREATDADEERRRIPHY